MAPRSWTTSRSSWLDSWPIPPKPPASPTRCGSPHAVMDAWESTPRIAFLSPEPGRGKTPGARGHRAARAAASACGQHDAGLPVPQGVRRGRAADDPVRRDRHRVRPEGQGQRGRPRHAQRRPPPRRRRRPLRRQGQDRETEELPAYCAVALAGLDDLPDTILTRSVIIRMRRRAPDEHVEPWRHRVNGPEADRNRRQASRLVQRVGGG